MIDPTSGSGGFWEKYQNIIVLLGIIILITVALVLYSVYCQPDITADVTKGCVK